MQLRIKSALWAIVTLQLLAGVLTDDDNNHSDDSHNDDDCSKCDTSNKGCRICYAKCPTFIFRSCSDTSGLIT